MTAVLEFVWFALYVAALVAVSALLLLAAYVLLACLVGRWVSTPDDDELDGLGRWVHEDGEEVGP